ncbi:hypothetical protein [Algoriphagus chordae]|uniref:Uncharacterized protein n=1 Tax=Algoriphagus chordae TaxID=237019 RepID=A0A2W7QXZ3_9BACT|nr:hypothetical protein [Algoriphagus chordae]PZX53144.1 hypothetical protein LV85_01559 [Algoriphagus chordae]
MSNSLAICTVIFLLISASFSTVEKEKIYVIIDDCQKWENPRTISGQYFSIASNKVCCVPPFNTYKGKDSLASVHLFNVDLDLNPPDLLKITFSELLDYGAKFSSEMSFEEWDSINSDEIDLYILLTDDFCSRKRFNYNEVFTVYKTNLVTKSYYTYQDIPPEGDYKRFFPIDSTRESRDLYN